MYPQRRKRACDTCHERKIQCERFAPDGTCNWCYHHSLPCTFNRKSASKKPTKPKFVSHPCVEQSLSQRLEQIEGAILQVVADSKGDGKSTKKPLTLVTTPSTSLEPKTSGVNPAGFYFTSLGVIQGPVPGSIPSPNGYDPWAQTRLHASLRPMACKAEFTIIDNGEPITLSRKHSKARNHNIVLGYLPKDFAPGLASWRFEGSWEELYQIPDAHVLNHTIRTFVRSSARQIFSLVDPVLFEQTIKLAYTKFPARPSPDSIQAKACILAFVPLMSYFSNGEHAPVVDCDAYTNRAYHMILETIECVSVVTLQTILMLHIHEIYSGRMQSAVDLHSISCQMVIKLGGHMYTPINKKYAEFTHADRMALELRLLFWHCYVFDKSISLRIGQKPLLPDTSCDLTFPDFRSLYSPTGTEINESSACFPYAAMAQFFPSDVMLSQIKAKTFEMLYSEEAESKTDAEILCAIRELDAELEYWRVSLPPNLRPALSIPGKHHVRVPKSGLSTRTRQIMSHLEYHNLIITIHQASGRCQHLQSDASLQHQWNPGIQSSHTLCLEASRSTLVYLEATVTRLEGEVFWIATYYPTVAIMALFHNIIAHPSHENATRDLELIRSSVAVVKNVPLARVSARATAYLQEVEDLVVELIRVANDAIMKSMAGGE